MIKNLSGTRDKTYSVWEREKKQKNWFVAETKNQSDLSIKLGIPLNEGCLKAKSVLRKLGDRNAPGSWITDYCYVWHRLHTLGGEAVV